MEQSEEYTLHFFPFSLYSLTARMAINIGKSLNSDNAPNIKIKLVNMQQNEHFSQHYLTQVSPKGQLPTLTSPALPAALTDSQDICLWLCKQQPELVPQEHKAAVERLVDEFYAFHAKAVVVAPENRKYGIPNAAAAMLEKSGLPEEYRRALEIKSVFHDSHQGNALDPENVAMTEQRVTDFIHDVSDLVVQRPESEGPWIFGNQPTVADAMATAMIARLQDVHRDDLLTDTAKAYAKGTVASTEWEATTHGRATMYNLSYGEIADFDPL